jgi:hypothetical protein
MSYVYGGVVLTGVGYCITQYLKSVFTNPEPITKFTNVQTIDCAKFTDELRNCINSDVEFSEIVINTADSEQLHALKSYNPRTTTWIIFAHNNINNMYKQSKIIKQLTKLSSVLIFDYRGCGNSTGVYSENGVYIDIQAIWNYLVIDNNILPSNIVLYGESVGAAIVTYLTYKLAKENTHPYRLVLQNGFTSVKKYLSYKSENLTYPPDLELEIMENMVQLNDLIGVYACDDYNLEEKLKELTHISKIPVLIAHSKPNVIVEYHNSENLYNVCENKINVTLFDLDTPHFTIFYDKSYLIALKKFLS